MVIDVDAGSDEVPRKFEMGDGGSCQYDFVGLALGSPGGKSAR